MTGNVWVFAEQWRGRITEITYEVLTLGREVADALGVRLEAVLLGHNVRHLAASLGVADSVLSADRPAFSEPEASVQAEALAQMAAQRKPRALLIPLTNVSLELGTLVGARLGSAAVNFCVDLTTAGGALAAKCLLYGGKIEATVAAKGEPAVFGIWPGTRPSEKGRGPASPPVEDVEVSLPPESQVRLLRYLEPEAGDIDISQQEILVAVGRGIQSRENIELAETLAVRLGGEVCGSRPVIDQGWLPLSRQVGKSGLTVKPKLYMALGISGAPEHVEGMKDAALIVAVNTDPNAPIFNLAHYGIVADALDIITALDEALASRAAHATKG